MNTIYLVRHGETEWNNSGKYQGQTDVPLNEKGLLQAAQCYEALKDVHFDYVLSSDLSRAYITAKTIIGKRPVPIKQDKRLREIDFGDWESLTYDEIDERWPNAIFNMYRHPESVRIQGGESFKDVQNRAWDSLLECIEASEDNSTILLVAHGGTNRTLICKILGLPLEYSWNLSQGNTGITRIFYYGMGKDDHNILNLLNDTRHIEGI